MAVKDGKESRTVNIHGKEYETVASRVQKFRQEPRYQDWSIETHIVERTDDCVVMAATIRDETGRLRATGYSEEFRGSSNINRTSALENAETSSIGRCLANLGLGGSEFASADEVANAIIQRNARPAPIATGSGSTTPPAPAQYSDGKKVSEAQRKLLFARSRDFSGKSDPEDIRAWFVDVVGKEPADVLMDDMDDVLKVLEEARAS